MPFLSVIYRCFSADDTAMFGAVYLGNSLKEGSLIREEALKLISGGLEGKLISVLQDLMSCSHPEQMVCLVELSFTFYPTKQLRSNKFVET